MQTLGRSKYLFFEKRPANEKYFSRIIRCGLANLLCDGGNQVGMNKLLAGQFDGEIQLSCTSNNGIQFWHRNSVRLECENVTILDRYCGRQRRHLADLALLNLELKVLQPHHAPSHSAARSLASTWSPAFTKIDLSVPARSAVSAVCIFMASS
jgi:hypothetical protein